MDGVGFTRLVERRLDRYDILKIQECVSEKAGNEWLTQVGRSGRVFILFDFSRLQLIKGSDGIYPIGRINTVSWKSRMCI